MLIVSRNCLEIALDKYPKLASGHYAVIADEAHSSQTGSSASKLKQILGSDAVLGKEGDAEEISAEELLDAAVAARAPTLDRGARWHVRH